MLLFYSCSLSFTEISLWLYFFFCFLVRVFSSSLFVMASFEMVKNIHGWLTDRKAFEPRATRSKVDPLRQIFGLEYEIPKEGFLVTNSRTVDERYFYLVSFTCGLRFPLIGFIVEVLRAYNVAPSQLHSNC